MTLGWEEGMVVEEIFKRVGWPVTTDKLVSVMQDDFEFRRPLGGTFKWTEDNHAATAAMWGFVWDEAKGEWVFDHDVMVFAPTGELTLYTEIEDIP